MELYGEGLERIFDAIAEDGSEALRARLVEDGVVASLMLIHDLYPGAAGGARAGGARQRAAVHGVARGERRAAGDRGRGREAAARGLVQRVRGVGVDAGAGGRGGACSATAPDLEGIDVEGVVEPPAPPALGTFELPMAGGGAPVSGWQALEGSTRPVPGALADRRVAADRQRRRRPARVSQPLRGLRRRARPRRPQRRHADLPHLRAEVRPAARRARATTGCSSARCRCCATATPCGSRWHDGDPAGPGDEPPPAPPGGAAAAGRGAARRTRSSASCARSRSPRRTGTCCTSTSGGSCACARRAGRCARATPSTARSATARCGSTTSRSPTSSGRRSRSRSGWRSSWSRPCRAAWSALYPSPAGATECELDLEAWERAGAPRTRCWQTLEADAEALVVNRMADPPQHAIVPIDVAYQLVGVVKASWEGISGGRGDRGGRRGLLRRLRDRSLVR